MLLSTALLFVRSSPALLHIHCLILVECCFEWIRDLVVSRPRHLCKYGPQSLLERPPPSRYLPPLAGADMLASICSSPDVENDATTKRRRIRMTELPRREDCDDDEIVRDLRENPYYRRNAYEAEDVYGPSIAPPACARTHPALAVPRAPAQLQPP
ncbi:hypothetical protein B0H15DRAFT_953365 [Mycena belliarum]|uniref:Uncharacterized protein n=1 Tax=Mycena belliarum TaxID=1033014 RepID=A0AAD6XMP8_9AGAR|nr:hypothetical protein B0H15DRAFT_953365 [Mycena belliae]